MDSILIEALTYEDFKNFVRDSTVPKYLTFYPQVSSEALTVLCEWVKDNTKYSVLYDSSKESQL